MEGRGAVMPEAPDLILSVPKNFSEELFLRNYSSFMLLRLIDGTSLSVEKLEYVDQTI